MFCFRYELEFGFTVPDAEILIENIRVRGVGKTHVAKEVQKLPFATDDPKEEGVIIFYLFKIKFKCNSKKLIIYFLL